MPKIISLLELYNVQNELSVACGFTVFFLFVLQVSHFRMPPELLLLPWVVWIGKKLLDSVLLFKTSVKELEVKFRRRARKLRRENHDEREIANEVYNSIFSY